MEAKTIRQLLKKYLLGRTPSAEQQTIDTWYNSFENDQPVSLTETERQRTHHEIWTKIEPAISPAPVRRLLWLKITAWAAVVAGIAFTILFVANRHTGPTAPTFTTIATKNGERNTVTIPDGTKLMLNAGTTIRVYDNFSTERRVDLVDGEVFFDVTRNPQKPFTIQSNGLTIAVLGTSFNVSSYAGLNKISVGVVTGKVSVTKQNDTIGVLQKAQELVFTKDTDRYTIIPLNEALLAWRNGTLVLNDLSFQEMSFLMKKNFGIDIQSQDAKVQQTKYTSDLPTSLTADEAVEVLAAIHQLKIKKVSNQFMLYR